MKKRSESPEPGRPEPDRGGVSDLLRRQRQEANAAAGRPPAAPPRGTTRVLARDEIEKASARESEKDDTSSFELPAGVDGEGHDDSVTPPPVRSARPELEAAPRDRAGRETRRVAVADVAPRPPNVSARVRVDAETEPDSVTDAQETVTFTYPREVVAASARAREPDVEPPPRARRQTERLPLCDVEPTQPDFHEAALSRPAATAAPRRDAAPPRGRAIDAAGDGAEAVRHRPPVPPAEPAEHATTVVRAEAQVPRRPPAERVDPSAATQLAAAIEPAIEPGEAADADEPEELDEAFLAPAPVVVSFLDPAPAVVSFLDPAPEAEPPPEPEPEPHVESFLEPGPDVESFLDPTTGTASYLDAGSDEESLIEQGLAAEPASEPAPLVESYLDPAPVVVSFIEPRRVSDPESTTRLDGLPPFALRDRPAGARADAERTDRFVKPRLRDEGERQAARPPSEIVPAVMVVERERSPERDAPTDPVVRSRPAAGDSLSFLLPWRTRRAPPWTYPAAERRDASRAPLPRRAGRAGVGALTLGAILVALGIVGGGLGVIAAIRRGGDLAPRAGRRANDGDARSAARAPQAGDAAPAAADAGRGRPAPLVVADAQFWTGEDGNRAIVVSARFVDRDRIARALDLSRPVGTFDGRPWSLAEVLVGLDLNANGPGATWRVSGPRDLIASYANELRRLERIGELYDLSIADLEVSTGGHHERREE